VFSLFEKGKYKKKHFVKNVELRYCSVARRYGCLKHTTKGVFNVQLCERGKNSYSLKNITSIVWKFIQLTERLLFLCKIVFMLFII
jgi:hypothetical protein